MVSPARLLPRNLGDNALRIRTSIITSVTQAPRCGATVCRTQFRLDAVGVLVVTEIMLQSDLSNLLRGVVYIDCDVEPATVPQ